MNRNTWIIIIVAVIVIIGLIWIFNRGGTPEKRQPTAIDTPVTHDQPSAEPATQLTQTTQTEVIHTTHPFIARDEETGCQYVYGIGIGITPRLRPDGTQVCE